MLEIRSSTPLSGEDTQMPPVVRLVNLILSGAAKNGLAISIWSRRKSPPGPVQVDGLLREVIKVPKTKRSYHFRMKIISGMDIRDRRALRTVESVKV